MLQNTYFISYQIKFQKENLIPYFLLSVLLDNSLIKNYKEINYCGFNVCDIHRTNR